MHKVIVGVDIGGSKILSGIISPQGQILIKKKEPTLPTRSYGDILDGICITIRELMQAIHLTDADILGIAVGAPGPLDHVTGVIKDPPNLAWRNLPIRDELSKRLGRQVLLENDANMAAWGEWKYGGGTKAGHNLIYMTVSTGIGGGIIINGQLYRGRNGVAGEFGRLKMQAGPDGEWMNLEDLASGKSLAWRAQQLINAGASRSWAEFLPEGTAVSAREIGDAARKGVPEATRIISTASRHLGIAIANLINIFNPDRFVLGGGTALGLADIWQEPIQKWVDAYIADYIRCELSIEFTKLGDDIGLLGCAAAVLQGTEKAGR